MGSESRFCYVQESDQIVNMVKKISGTTANSDGYSSEVPYPTGFTSSNCVVAGLSIKVYGNYRTGEALAQLGDRCFAEMTSTGVKVYTTGNQLNNCDWKAVLIKC